MKRFTDIFSFVVFLIVVVAVLAHCAGDASNSSVIKCEKAGGVWKHVGGVGVAKYNSVCELPKGK